jgi:hypothetical protein
MDNVKQSKPGTYVPYNDRFPSKEDYEGCKRLIEWYGHKYPGLRVQWEGRIRAYEFGQEVNIWM